MKKLILFLLLGLSLQAQDLRVEPLNWWVGMKNPKLQLLVHGKDLKGSQVISNKAGLKVLKVHNADSPNYLFVDCEVAKTALAGSYPIDIKKDNKVIHHIDYKLEARSANSANRPSYSTKDVIYLITPDRFANGDPSNDAKPGYREPNPARNEMYGRHILLSPLYMSKILHRLIQRMPGTHQFQRSNLRPKAQRLQQKRSNPRPQSPASPEIGLQT